MPYLEGIKFSKLVHRGYVLLKSRVLGLMWLGYLSYCRIAAKWPVKLDQIEVERIRLVIDISNFSHDATSGIPRVTREFVKHAPSISYTSGVELLLVRSPRFGVGYESLHYNVDNTFTHTIPYAPSSRDVFLGLHLNTFGMVKNQKYLSYMKSIGVKLHFLIYDLIPLSNPEYWPNKRAFIKSFKLWLNVLIGLKAHYITISKTVKSQLIEYMPVAFTENNLSVWGLGFELDIQHKSESETFKIDWLDATKSSGSKVFLSVGTLEPRKGLADVYAALKEISRLRSDWMWVIVGRLGWGVDSFIENLEKSKYLKGSVVWLAEVQDDLLKHLYRSCNLLIAASYAEGLGLPILEANAHGLPVLARDIDIFREISGDSGFLFDCDRNSLEKQLLAFLDSPENFSTIQNCGDFRNWYESSLQLFALLNLSKSVV